MATRTIDEAKIVLKGDSKDLERDLNGAVRKIEGFAKKAVGALAVFAGGRELLEFGKRSLNVADDIGAAAEAAGIGAERFQTLGYAFEQSDVKQKEFEEGMRRLNRRFGEFLNSGGGPAAAAIRDLGLEADITSGKINSTEQFFDAIIRKLEGFEDQSRVSALAAQLFGDDAGPKLVQALRLGTDGIRELEEAAKGIFSQEDIDRASAMNDTLADLNRQVLVPLEAAFIRATVAAAEFFGLFDIGTASTTLIQGRINELSTSLVELDARLMKISDKRARATLQKSIREIQDELDRLIAIRDQRTEKANDTAPTVILPAVEDGGTIGSWNVPDTRPSFVISDQETSQIQGRVRSLEIDAIRASGNVAEAMRQSAMDQIAAWQEYAAEAPQFAGEAAKAIEAINAKLNADLKSLDEKRIQELDRASREWTLTLNEGLTDAIFNVRSLDDVFDLFLKRIANSVLFGKDGTSGLLGGITSDLGGWLGGLLGGRAGGGDVQPGKAIWVGERGKELFVPKSAGTIKTAADSRAMAGAVIHQENHWHFDGTYNPAIRASWQNDIAQASPSIAAATLNALQRSA